jgi:hypothetical protein
MEYPLTMPYPGMESTPHLHVTDSRQPHKEVKVLFDNILVEPFVSYKE